ncbi:MAG TPA: hemolysin family protein [Gemmatimonadales bacterium]|nr:hemolysin family protein [Gemmatimonadales bacterium]
MIWLALALGLLLTTFGAAAGAAQMTVSRRELARALSRRLRGAGPPLDWLIEVDARLTAASATTSLGAVLLAASLPAVLGSTLAISVAAVAIMAIPFALAAGYLVPRWLTEPRAEHVLSAIMPILKPWSRVVGIVLPRRSGHRQQDLRTVWREITAPRAADDDEMALIGGVMSFTQRQVREVMTPRTEMVAVSEDTALGDIGRVFAESGYSRIPVYRRTLDEVVGMLHAFDLFKLRESAVLPIRPVAVAPATRNCGDLLLDMQRERRHLAIVIDEFGGTLGLVTLEDLLEELVGEIFDEHDEASGSGAAGASAAPTSALAEADGTVSAADIAERFGIELPHSQATTLAGLIADLAGRIPAAGERFTLGPLEVDIVQASPARIERMLVRRSPSRPIRLGATP